MKFWILASEFCLLGFKNMKNPDKQSSLVWKKLKRNRIALVGRRILIFFLLLAVLANWITPFNPIKQDLRFSLDTPSWKNWLGRDELGRDIL
ncbi:MAG: hypothetical protein EHM45_19180, partial [Desulfobacteraceae bacterium]